MSGFAHLTGPEDGPPTLPPFGLADGVAGIAGAFAVTAGLLHRVRTRRGQVIDISLLEPLLGILGPSISVYDQLGLVPGRHGNRSPNNAPRNVYRTRDDQWVAISASATSVARRVMDVIGHPEVSEEPWFDAAGERAAHADLLDDLVQDWILQRNMDEVVATFNDAGAAIAPIYDVGQLSRDPHVLAREIITTVDDEDLGPLRMQNLMFRMSESPGSIRWAGRRLGQDNESVFGELLGLDVDAIEDLRREGVI
jgi:crotonobetainyl-CoA:carnitine CoA-transferase CaiB-like acyl-CoA transferase